MKACKHTLSVLFFLLVLNSVKAQLNRQWVNNYNTADTAYMYVVNLFDGGNGSVVKVTMASKHVFPITYSRLLLQKVDPAGNLLWEQTYTHPIYNAFNIYKAVRDAAGNMYLCGQVTLSQSEAHWFILSFDGAGQFRWKKEIVENNFTEGYSRAIVADAAGNVYASGSVTKNGATYGVIVKYDSNGNEQWVKKVLNDYSYGLDMIIASNGDLVASNGEYEITRISSAGNVLWSTPDTTQWVYASPSLAEGADGSIYAITFLGYNYSLKKLSASGAFQWNKQDFATYLAFGDNSVKLLSDPDGSIYAYGLNSTDSVYQTAVFKINSSGQEIWRQPFQNLSGGISLNDVSDMIMLPNGSLALSGSTLLPNYYGSTLILNKNTGNVLDIDTISAASLYTDKLLYNTGGLYVSGQGNYETFLIKYASTVSIKENEPTEMDIEIYPNPFVDYITIKSEFDITRYELRNISGQLIRSVQTNGNITLPLHGISSGVYLLNVYGNNGQQALRKIIKQ